MNDDWAALSEADRARLIESLREIGLRLDREGRFWHEGELVRHPGLARALHRWLDRLDDGRFIVRLDAQRFAYVEVEDAPYIVRTIVFGDADQVLLELSDETSEELAYDTLRVGDDHALYCEVHGRFEARFSRQAYYLLSERIVEHEHGYALRAARQEWAIRARGEVSGA